MADNEQTLTVQGTDGHLHEVVTVAGAKASFQKFKRDLIGIPNTTEAVFYTETEVNAYNAELEDALDSTTPLTADQAEAYNTAVAGASKEAGDTLSEAEANAYNATLEGAISTESVKTPATPKKVKDYVDENAVSGVSFNPQTGKIQQTKNGQTSDITSIVNSGFSLVQDDVNGIDEFAAIGGASITEDDDDGIDEFDF